jgi:selenophosphate synthetase-related protein
MRAITPLLAVGQPAVDEIEAFVRIKTGEVAVVADDATARLVLAALGMSGELIEDRIHFSRTGEVLVEG